MVFCGLFPIDGDDYPDLRDALEKLTLNDAALDWEPETSDALGFGFRCGFLGLLHMDIVRERLEREYDLELMATMPSVSLRGDADRRRRRSRSTTRPTCPTRRASPRSASRYIKASILTPEGVHRRRSWSSARSAAASTPGMHYLVRRPRADRLRPAARRDRPGLLRPAEVAHPRLRVASTTRSAGCRPSNLAKLDVLLAGDPVDALSMVVHRDKAYEVGRTLTEKLREKIPRQQYDVPIQAAIGSHIIARETVKAFRKDVTAKCYGGDISRKRKLLERQKEGKKRMKQVGRVEVPAGGVPGRARARRRRARIALAESTRAWCTWPARTQCAHASGARRPPSDSRRVARHGYRGRM